MDRGGGGGDMTRRDGVMTPRPSMSTLPQSYSNFAYACVVNSFFKHAVIFGDVFQLVDEPINISIFEPISSSS